MRNVDMHTDGDTLTITVDLRPSLGGRKASKSGKSTIIASTEGAHEVGGFGVYVNLNVYEARTRRGGGAR